MNPACTQTTAALAAGEPVDAAHVAACPDCRARAALVAALGPFDVGVTPLPAPTAPTLRARYRRRVASRVAVVLAVAALLALALRPQPAPPDVDLLAALDDADAVVEPSEPLDEDLLALLEPDDPSAAADPLIDALLGEGSL